MLRGNFVKVAGNQREYNGKQYFNLKLKIGNYIYDASTDADTYVKLQDFQNYSGVFSLYGMRTGGLQLRLDGIE